MLCHYFISFSRSAHGGQHTGVVFGPLNCILMTAYHEIENVDTQPIKLLLSIDVFERKV